MCSYFLRGALDYYHAIEKIEHLAKHQFEDESIRNQWLDQQKELLINNGVLQVISNIKKLRSKNLLVAQAKQKAINYYEEHEDRMMYKTYKEQGLLIGSGPIEAAH